MTERTLQLVHSDVAYVETESLSGHRYVVNFIDDLTRFARVYFMRTKDECLDKFKEFVAECGTPERLRTDNGGEYISNEFKEYCKEQKTFHEFTVPYNPNQNGLAERYWRTSMDAAHTLLHESKLPKSFWLLAISTVNHVRNRCVTAGLTDSRTTCEMFFNKKPDLSSLRIFGCSAFVHQRDRTKLDPTAAKGIFVETISRVLLTWCTS